MIGIINRNLTFKGHLQLSEEKSFYNLRTIFTKHGKRNLPVES